MKVLCVKREERFSPGSVEKDLKILSLVNDSLLKLGVDAKMVDARDLIDNKVGQVDAIFSMARGEDTLACLRHREEAGTLVLNPMEGLDNTNRYTGTELFMQHEIPMPLTSMVDSPEGFEMLCEQWRVRCHTACWLKRADACAQQKSDVVYCPDVETLEKAGREMFARGVKRLVVCEHVVGDIVKFYGVEGADFFSWYKPDIRTGKYGLEVVNGEPNGYEVNETIFMATCERAARVTRCPIYGGDAVITPQGNFKIIDFNDWPSFSVCAEDAAKAIVKLLKREWKQRHAAVAAKYKTDMVIR